MTTRPDRDPKRRRRTPRRVVQQVRHQLTNPTVSNMAANRHGEGQAVSDAITRFSGSMTFVWVHIVWFAAWIVLNLVLTHPFDKFPFGLLTLIVSLEAIFLSTFVLISQNQQGEASTRREVQDFQTNIYSEALSELIAEHLGITGDQVDARYQANLRNAGFSHDERRTAAEASDVS